MEKKKQDDKVIFDSTKINKDAAPDTPAKKPAPVALPKLKCTRSARGIYRLYRELPDGTLRFVPRIGRSEQPFEVVAQFPNQPIVAVKRYIKTGRTVTPRLYLIDLNTGKIPAMSDGGVPFIYYNKARNKFVADPTAAAAADTHELSSNDTAPTLTTELYLQYLQQLQMILATALGKKLDIVARPSRRRKAPRRPRPLQAADVHLQTSVPYSIHKKPTMKYRVIDKQMRPRNVAHAYVHQQSQHVH